MLRKGLGFIDATSVRMVFLQELYWSEPVGRYLTISLKARLKFK